MPQLVLPPITSAMLVLTHRCCMACRYCFVQQENSDMTYETAKAAADFLLANSKISNVTPEINFFGGEPMLMWDSIIVPLTNYIRNELGVPFKLSITTNGALLNHDKLKFLKQNRIGCMISLDGKKETQDYNRPMKNGVSSFDIIEPMLPACLEAYPDLTLRMTTIPPTCRNVFENIMWGDSLGYTNYFVVPNVFEAWDEQSRKTLKAQMEKYGDYYIESYRSGKRPIEFSTLEKAFPLILAHNRAEYSNTFRCGRQCVAAGKCGLGASRFASIDPLGNVYACQEMTSNKDTDNIFCIGNIYDGVDDEKRYRLMDAFDSSIVTGDHCSDCPLYRVCDGGCVANNYMITGSLSKLPPVYCWWMRVIFDLAVRIMQTLGNEENALFKKHWDKIKR